MSIKPLDRFLQKIEISSESCWEWQGCTSNGYGQINIDRKTTRAHRFIYEYYHGKISSELQIDHLCSNRKCVNPNHLEQVTQQENNLRSMSISGINSRKTHCIRGHKFTDENIYYWKKSRHCRICIKIKNRRNYPKSRMEMQQ